VSGKPDGRNQEDSKGDRDQDEDGQMPNSQTYFASEIADLKARAALAGVSSVQLI